MKRLYLDYAATTPLDPRVKRAMEPYFAKHFGNPSSIHAEGVVAKKALDAARATVARALEAHPDEIIFTSGGTESNNLAIFGAVESVCRSLTPTRPVGVKLLQKPRLHIITTNIEHSSVLEPLRALEKRGVEVSYVPVETNGIVKTEKILAAIRPNTVLVSVMYANNEIGTIQPIAKIGKAIRELRGEAHKKNLVRVGAPFPLFHTDACQTPLYLNCLVNALGVDLLTLDGHKIYGPKGVGALYVRRGTTLAPQLLGGGQERGLRSTTENISSIVGFAEALRLATTERKTESLRLKELRDKFYADVLENIRTTRIILNGDRENRLPNNLNISLPKVDTEMLVLKLDAAGIACSTKSSCLKDEKRSYVIAALGGDEKRAESSLRFTLGHTTTAHDLARVAKILSRIV